MSLTALVVVFRVGSLPIIIIIISLSTEEGSNHILFFRGILISVDHIHGWIQKAPIENYGNLSVISNNFFLVIFK